MLGTFLNFYSRGEYLYIVFSNLLQFLLKVFGDLSMLIIQDYRLLVYNYFFHRDIYWPPTVYQALCYLQKIIGKLLWKIRTWKGTQSLRGMSTNWIICRGIQNQGNVIHENILLKRRLFYLDDFFVELIFLFRNLKHHLELE